MNYIYQMSLNIIMYYIINGKLQVDFGKTSNIYPDIYRLQNIIAM